MSVLLESATAAGVAIQSSSGRWRRKYGHRPLGAVYESLFRTGILYGHGGRPDSTLPILLLSRARCMAFYGPEIPRLAAAVLGNSLAWEALGAPH